MKDLRKVKGKQSGFSLLELLTVVAIFGILASIAVPSISSRMPEYRLKKAARDLYSNFQRAKFGAVKSNEYWGIFFDKGASSYSIYSLGGNRQWDGGGSDDVLQNITINFSDYEGVNYGWGSAAKNIDDDPFGVGDDITYASPDKVVVFTYRGTVDNPGHVYISNNKGSSYAVGTPSPSGAVVMLKHKNNAWE